MNVHYSCKIPVCYFVCAVLLQSPTVVSVRPIMNLNMIIILWFISGSFHQVTEVILSLSWIVPIFFYAFIALLDPKLEGTALNSGAIIVYTIWGGQLSGDPAKI